MGKGFFEQAQRFGKSFMLPIAVLPAAGLLLGIGGAFSNPTTIEVYSFLDQKGLQAIFTVMSSAGNIVFANLALIFAVGVAIGLARNDKGTAGLAAVLGYLVMNAMLIVTEELAESNCATRLRVSVCNPEHVQKETLMKTGAKGVVRRAVVSK